MILYKIHHFYPFFGCFFLPKLRHFYPNFKNTDLSGSPDHSGHYYTIPPQVIPLHQITMLHHGLMMVGPSGSGQSSPFLHLSPPPLLPRQVHGLAGAPEGPGAPGGVEGVSHVIDPKDPGLVTSSPAARVLLLLTSPPPPLLLSFPPLLLSLPPLNKEDLYGVLDPNTREWTDGPSTHILRFLHFLPSGFVFPWIC